VIDSTWLPTSLIEPWYRPQRRTEIVPGVWVGDRIDAKALWNREGWTVIDVRESDTEADPKGVVRIPLLRKDTDHNAGRKALWQIADAIDLARAKGDNVIVHCWQGLERSPLSIVGWLVLRQGYTLDDAYRLLIDKRGAWDRRTWLTKKARRALAA
jgi:rhodanese-related sulfurtransferase